MLAPMPGEGSRPGGLDRLAVEEPPEILGQRGRAGVAHARVHLQALADDETQISRQLDPAAGRGNRAGVPAGQAQPPGPGRAGRGVPQQGEMEGAAQPIDIRGRPDLAAVPVELLGRHEGRGADDAIGKGEGRLVQGHGQAEITDVRRPAPAGLLLQEDIGGLEIPVDQLQVVGGVDGFRHLRHHGHHRFHGQIPAGLLQIGPLHQLHGDLDRPLGTVHIIDPADVRMGHPGLDLGFMHEADQAGRLHVAQDLQRHPAAQHDIPGIHHFPHAPLAQKRPQDIAPLPPGLGVEPRGLELQDFAKHGVR